MSNKKFFLLLLALTVIVLLIFGCNTTKKATSKEVHKTDSSVVINNHESLTTETGKKADVVTNEITTSESNFEVITVDSGKNVVVSDGSEYFTVETKKPTKFILPKKSEKKVITTIDKSTVNKTEAAEKVEEKKVDVKKADVVIEKEVKRTGISFWFWLIGAIAGTVWCLDKRYNIIAKAKNLLT